MASQKEIEEALRLLEEIKTGRLRVQKVDRERARMRNLRRRVETQLYVLKAKKAGITVSPEEVDEIIRSKK